MTRLDRTNNRWARTDTAPVSETAPAQEKTGFVDGLIATNRLDNPFYNLVNGRRSYEFPQDSDFDYKSYPKEDWAVVHSAHNKDHAEYLLGQANEERAARKIVDNQHWALGLTNSAVVGIATNPLNLIGGGTAKTVLGAVARNGVSSAVGTAASEAILHSQQVTRTLEDSGQTVAGALVLGGVAGGAVKAIGNRISRGAFTANEFEKIPTPRLEADATVRNSVGAAAVTQKTMADMTVARMPEWMIRTSFLGPLSRSANQRLSTSSLLSSRNAISKLTRQNIATEGNLAGIANEVPLDVSIGQSFGNVSTSILEADNNLRKAWWSKVESGVYDKAEILDELRKMDPRLPDDYKVTPNSFDKVLKAYMADDTTALAQKMPEVGDRVRAGAVSREAIDADRIDYGLAEKHQLEDIATGQRIVRPDDTPEALKLKALNAELEKLEADLKLAKTNKLSKPEIEKASKLVNDAKVQKAQTRAALTKIEEDYKNLQVSSKTHKFATADSSHYLSRVFDKGRIMRDSEGFVDDVVRGWADRNPDLDLTDAATLNELKDAARMVVNKLLNEDMTVTLGDIKKGLDTPGNYIKDRTLALDDKFIMNWTHDNVSGAELHYLSQAIADVEMAKAGVNYQDIIASIDLEVQARREAINAEFGVGTKKAALAIQKLMNEVEQDKVEIKFVVQKLKRQNTSVDGALGSAQEWWSRLDRVAGMAQLGVSALPNSLGDLASIARNFGTSNFLKTAFKAVFDADFRADIKQNAKALGVMSDFVNKSVTALHGDELASASLDPNKGFKSIGLQRVDNVLDKVGDVFSKVSLIQPWAKAGRLVASTASTQHLVELAGKGWKNLDATTRMDLAKFYVDESLLGRIADQIKKYSTDVDGFKFAGIEQWDDAEAVRIFKASVYARTEHALNIPSVGAGSQFMTNTFWGRMFMRFKAFSNASYESTFLASMQNREASRIVAGTMNYAFWSMLGLYTYDTITGRPNDMEDYFGDTEKAQKTGWKILTRSGFMAAPQDAFITISKGLGSDFSPIKEQYRELMPEGLENEIFSKYADVSPLEKAVGPTFGYAKKATEGVLGMLDGEASERDIGNIRSSLPFQNVQWLRRGLDYVEEYLGGRKADRFENQ